MLECFKNEGIVRGDGEGTGVKVRCGREGASPLSSSLMLAPAVQMEPYPGK